MNRAKKALVILMLAVTMVFGTVSFAPIVSAQTDSTSDGTGNKLICRIFPFIEKTTAFGINSLCHGVSASSTAQQIRGTIQLIVSLIFIAIILFAIFVIVRAAIKYIRSEGDETKIQEAQKAIKSVFVGIAALFVGLVGVIIVLVFFGASDAINTFSQNDVNSTNNPLLQQLLNN